MKQLNCHCKGLLKKLTFFFLGMALIGKTYGQVNLQTGSATFSLPMFNWQDHKSRLNSVVALSYNSGSGLKVSDVASNVGQGWSLVAGGVITRLQVGEPDDQMAYGTSNPQDLTKYPAGYLYALSNASNGCPVAMTKYPIYKAKNQLYKQHNSVAEDRELDYFSFQFNGKAGMFVLNKATGNTGISLGDSKIKISFQTADQTNSSTRTTITSFTIQDVDGLLYKFDRQGKTKVLKESYCDVNQAYQQEQPKFENTKVYHKRAFDNDPSIVNPWIVGSWYLSEVKDPLTLRTISFTYTSPRLLSNEAGEDISFNDGDKDYVLITHKKSITQTPDIASINYPDGHTVTFSYSSKQRADLNGAFPLASVDIKYNGRSLSQYQLNTTYFIKSRYGTPTFDYQKSVARLCLKSVKKTGVDLKEDSPPYVFDYYLGGSAEDDFVPPPFFYAKDIWGFYNGNYSKGYNDETIDLNTTATQLGETYINGPFGKPIHTPLGFNRLKGLCFLNKDISGVVLNAKPNYARNGLLKQIIYPTGGTLSYEYEQNLGTPLNTSGTGTYGAVGGVHVSQTSSTDGGYSNGCANPIKTLYSYVLDEPGAPSSLWGLEAPKNSLNFTSHYEPQSKYWTWSWSCVLSCCKYRFTYPGILSEQQAINLVGFQKFMESAAPVLGILSVVTTIMDIANVIGGSTGFLAWAAVVVDVIGGLITLGITCFGDQSKNSSTTVYYNSDLNGISPLPTQFKRVEVVENPGTIGKTVYDFTSDDDYQIWVGPGGNSALSARQRFAPWAYGLPELTTVFNNLGNKVKQVRNVYNFTTLYHSNCGGVTLSNNRDVNVNSDIVSGPHLNDSEFDSSSAVFEDMNDPHYNRSLLLKQPLNTVSAKCLVRHTSSLRNDEWSNPDLSTSSTSDIETAIYDLYTGRAELDTTYEKTFNAGDNTKFVEKTTVYIYNDENYEPSLIKTFESDGHYRQKNIYYTIDFKKVYDDCHTLTAYSTNNPEINRLVQNNILNLPVETNEMVTDFFGGNVLKTTYDKATVFTTLGNGDIRPSAMLEGRLEVPVNTPSLWGRESNQSYLKPAPLYIPDNPDYNFYKIAQTFSYDAASNLSGVKDEGNRAVTNIYDYNDKYVTASIVNADATTDKSAYTSFETEGLGGWGHFGILSYNNSLSVTGTRSLDLFPQMNLTCTGLNTSKQYRLSFWATGNTFSLSDGYSLVSSGPTINGFTYYEYDIQPGLSSVTISGSGCTIDELRLYPKAARMRTVSYDPLIGKTSECDENNRITYYEYDKLGRLRFIKDENQNVLKMYEYNNVSKQTGCPATFTNNLVTEIFTKSNCGPNFIGDQVTYTVPAGKYSSSISQADADAQAELELLTNGQANADANGACKLIYYNTAQSRSDTSENCPEGYKGSLVTYAVPAGRYFSLLSQEDADSMALADLDANAWAYINDPAHAGCTLNTDPEWVAEEGAAVQCQAVNGEMHKMMLATDVNPNSLSYGQTSWQDSGVSNDCPQPELSIENGMGCGFTLIFTNTSTGEQSLFDVEAHSSLSGVIPIGNYNISITNSCNLNATYSIFCNDYFGYGSSSDFYNVYYDGSCSTIYINP